MGRFLMYATILLLTVFVASSYTVLQHGSEGLGQIKVQQLSMLTSSPNAYNGAEVVTDGILVHNERQDTYEITELDGNYATPIEKFDTKILASLVGRRVRVKGTFAFVQGEGFHIDATDIHAQDPEPSPTATGF